jgi:hypothetical protein
MLQIIKKLLITQFTFIANISGLQVPRKISPKLNEQNTEQFENVKVT